jgi:hypothetical protein
MLQKLAGLNPTVMDDDGPEDRLDRYIRLATLRKRVHERLASRECRLIQVLRADARLYNIKTYR